MNKKVIVLYRVIQEWRAPIFEELNKQKDIKLFVWHGPDFSDSKVVSTKKEYTFFKKKLISIKLIINSKNGKIFMPFSPFLFFNLIIENPNVIIAEGASNIANSIQGFIYSKLFNKKFIWWSLGKLKNRDYDVKRSRIDKIIQFIERNSTAVISYSQQGKEYFKSIGVLEDKIFVATNVVDTKSIIRKLKEKKCIKYYNDYHKKYDFISLFVGALTKEKSIDKLLYSQKIIENKKKNLGLIIVGDGNYINELKKLSKSLNLKNVEFLGKIVNDNYKVFSSADLFVLPGLGGLAISEAMCYGLPIICSIGDGCELDLVTKNNGIVDDNLNSEKLAEYIIDYSENLEKTKEQGRISFKIVNEKYNTTNYLNQIIEAINYDKKIYS